MAAGEQLTVVLHLPQVEGVVQNPSDRSHGEQPGFNGEVTLRVGKLVHVPGAESLVIEPAGQLGQGRGPGGISLEQLAYRRSFLWVDVETSRVFRVTFSCLSPRTFSQQGWYPKGIPPRWRPCLARLDMPFFTWVASMSEKNSPKDPNVRATSLPSAVDQSRFSVMDTSPTPCWFRMATDSSSTLRFLAQRSRVWTTTTSNWPLLVSSRSCRNMGRLAMESEWADFPSSR